MARWNLEIRKWERHSSVIIACVLDKKFAERRSQLRQWLHACCNASVCRALSPGGKRRMSFKKTSGELVDQENSIIACLGSSRVFLGFPGGTKPWHATVLIHCVHGEGGLGPSGPRPA